MFPTSCIELLFHKLEAASFKATANKQVVQNSSLLMQEFCCLFEVPIWKQEINFSWNPIFMEVLVTQICVEQEKKVVSPKAPENKLVVMYYFHD